LKQGYEIPLNAFQVSGVSRGYVSGVGRGMFLVSVKVMFLVSVDIMEFHTVEAYCSWSLTSVQY
jgi:hypothetical protein